MKIIITHYPNRYKITKLFQFIKNVLIFITVKPLRIYLDNKINFETSTVEQFFKLKV